MSTTWTAACTTLRLRDISASRSRRSSGTLATPMLGSLVANAYGAARAPPPVRALYNELLPALGSPTSPKRSMRRSRLTALGTVAPVTPLEALDRAIHYLDRAHETGFKAKAFVRAREVVRELPPGELEERAEAGTLTDLNGIGAATARLITEALTTDEPSYLAKLDGETVVPITPEGQRYRDALRGDCHTHSTWSDGGATIEAMAAAAIAIGHEYMVLTDHSPRLTIAHGLDRERLISSWASSPCSTRSSRRSASSPGWRSTSTSTARSTSTTISSPTSTSSSPACTPSCAWTARR